MKDINFLGVTIRLGRKPQNIASKPGDTKKRATGTIRKQIKRNVSFQISDLTLALNMAQNPDMPDRNRLHEIYRYVGRDGHLKSQIRTAKIKVLSEPWMIYKGKATDDAMSEDLRKRWMNDIIEYIIEAELHGYSVVEITWKDKEGKRNGATELIDREYVSIEKQWILIEAQVNGSYLPYADIMWDIDLLEFGKRNDFGTLLECSYNVLWKYYSRSDWSRASEKVGAPILAITADTNTKTELDDLESKAANFGNDGYIIAQKGDDIKLIERSGQRFHDVYLDNIKLCNDEVSKIVNGQTGLSDQKAFVGAVEAQERVMDDFTFARMQYIVDEMNEKTLPYLVYKGIIADGYRFDYPALIRERERRLKGQAGTTDPKEEPNTDPKEDPKNPQNKK